MSSMTKPFEEKMNASVNHLVHELASIRAGRANAQVLDELSMRSLKSSVASGHCALILSISLALSKVILLT